MTNSTIKVGDAITIAGVNKRNPAWRWWTFWRPKALAELRTFKVTSISQSSEGDWVDVSYSLDELRA